MLRKTLVAIVLSVLVSANTFAQDNSSKISSIEDSLVVLSDSMYKAFIPDDRVAHTQQFVKLLISALKEPNSYNYNFPKLGEVINIIYPEDKSFRIFNWAIAPTAATMRYYGAIQLQGDELQLIPLYDYSQELKRGLEDSILNKGKWFGGIIYKIMTNEYDGDPIYTLFTKNGSSPISNKKALDPMQIQDGKNVVFGAPIFNMSSSEDMPERTVNRFVIEYKKTAQASMNFDAELNAIYFDHLISEMDDPNRKYSYVPSGQYDGFRWQKGQWQFVKNLIPIEVREDGNAPAPVPVGKKED